ncbi:hypothetical protein EV44_g3818 [Erysiphe necator]|uniref:Uncharacterized protein n=1 Tax=Uncinula necator TaxID=52586 RepID=A0A0B1P5G9_UNCNE|nr:hypothetical protein EV44_g3818 [Erysiphe necator]
MPKALLYLEENKISYFAKWRYLRIGSRKKGKLVHASNDTEHGINSKSTTANFNAISIIGSESNFIEVQISTVSSTDIYQALQPKRIVSISDIEGGLPDEIKQFSNLFTDDDGNTDVLPPHRPGVDTKIVLQKDEQGRDKENPWSPLYNMSRDELLVLQKKLAKLHKERWIRASSLPGGPLVMFVKKPVGGLRFCVDYRALNPITEWDRYPLPLIREIFRMIAKAN